MKNQGSKPKRHVLERRGALCGFLSGTNSGSNRRTRYVPHHSLIIAEEENGKGSDAVDSD